MPTTTVTFPEPDLPPFRPDAAFMARVDAATIELPLARRVRFVQELGIKEVQAELLAEERENADFFEAVCAAGVEARTAAAWIAGDVDKHLKRRNIGLAESSLSASRLSRLIGLVESGAVSRNGARELLEAVLDRDEEPEALAAELGLEQEDNSDELIRLIAGITEENPQAAQQIRSGDLKPLGFLVGQVMKASGGKADPKQVQTLLRRQFGI